MAKGTQLANQTAEILSDIRESTKSVIENILRIKEASADQAVALEQINQGLTQVASVVQTNAAAAEENSATSEEMSSLAVTLHEEVGKFKLKNSYKKSLYTARRPIKETDNVDIDLSDDESFMGKY